MGAITALLPLCGCCAIGGVRLCDGAVSAWGGGSDLAAGSDFPLRESIMMMIMQRMHKQNPATHSTAIMIVFSLSSSSALLSDNKYLSSVGPSVGGVVGDLDGGVVGDLDGDPDGPCVGGIEGDLDGGAVGDLDGDVDGPCVGGVVGVLDGDPDGPCVGGAVGDVDGEVVGAADASVGDWVGRWLGPAVAFSPGHNWAQHGRSIQVSRMLCALCL